MTMVELAQEARELAKEYWWNGVGVVVLAFLLVTSIWRNGDDYLLYAALIFVVVHAGVAMWGFGHRRAQRLDEKHRRELVVAYRRGLEQAQNTHTEETHERPRGRRVPAFAVVTRRAA
ncbi:membrane protein [Mycobacterium phage I3]|uniref:Membrane protein n=1 Tax=Mycobacterium phage I3 TaxID=2994057 RepID=A0A8F2IWT3_9CAUD|nr:membrane protein [Mycobacterium phage I3]QWT30480.1 membrane protein [Mycobacterium phage I3]